MKNISLQMDFVLTTNFSRTFQNERQGQTEKECSLYFELEVSIFFLFSLKK